MKDEDNEITTCSPNNPKQSLLKKFDIPIGHLSYDYVGVCKNGKDLERIVQILRSGEEGSFPHLTSTAEARLALVKPESAVLRVPQPVLSRASLPSNERNELDAELNGWLGRIKLLERDLEDEKIAEDLPKPAVRMSNSISDCEPSKKSPTSNVKDKRLSSCDYASWDKYDADTELERIDLLEELRIAKDKKRQRMRDAELEKHFTENVVKKSLLTGTEQQILRVREREKGNEAYRAGDYMEALRLYSASIFLDDDVNTYNNRAMTNLKLKNPEKALRDYNTVLEVDCTNVKALLGRGLVFEHLEKYLEALRDYEKVLTLDATNTIAISSIQKLKNTKKVRLTIEEVRQEG